ncbi:MAG: sulfatase [Planctomycetes bacterium]|nr:sulfatase [Planctomycetota bacterium]
MSKQPNIIFMHSHNTGRFIQPYGHAVPTPHLQQAAEEGCMFYKAFAAAPTCSPSRASFLTGRYPHSCGMLGLAHRGFALNNHQHHIARATSAFGYQSVLCGVEHLAAFQNTTGDEVGYDRVLTPDGNPYAHAIAPEICNFLQEDHEKPFFMSVGFQETHTPFPDPEPEDYPAEDARYCTPPMPFANTDKMRENTAAYKHCARDMDNGFGAVLDCLKETGLDANTYVFCFTDHGLQWPLHIGNVGEHGNGVFLIAKGPKYFTPGSTNAELVSLIDLYPTVCDLIGMDKPDWLQGASLLPLLNGEVEQLHEHIFLEQSYHAAYEPMRAVRNKRYMYIKRYDNREDLVLPNSDSFIAKEDMLEHGWADQPRHQEMLYDMYFDSPMLHNLIDDPQHAARKNEMAELIEDWMEATSDPLCSGEVTLPKGFQSTDPNAEDPHAQPYIIGEDEVYY